MHQNHEFFEGHGKKLLIMSNKLQNNSSAKNEKTQNNTLVNGDKTLLLLQNASSSKTLNKLGPKKRTNDKQQNSEFTHYVNFEYCTCGLTTINNIINIILNQNGKEPLVLSEFENPESFAEK
jgi:hypothetical protein